MSKEITTTVYTYEELVQLHKEGKVKSEALERAKQWLREGATDHNWWDYLYEEWKEALEAIGFTDAEISFSGFWCQGDGASFTSNIDFTKLIEWFTGQTTSLPENVQFLEKRLPNSTCDARYLWLELIVNNLSGGVSRTCNRYSHQNTCRFEIELDSRRERPEVEKFVDDFQKEVDEFRYALSTAIYKSLEETYEAITSDEAIAENAEANEYTFTIYGKRMG